MNHIRLVICSIILLGLSLTHALAQAPAPTTKTEAIAPSISDEFLPINERIITKIKASQTTAADLESEIKDFDALIEKHYATKTDEVAEIVFMRIALYVQVLENLPKTRELLTELKRDFPTTKRGQEVDRILASIDAQAKAEAAKAALIGQPAPELHFTWATRPGLKMLSELRGKVVILDFWATWCGPCVGSFPQVAELVAHYQGYDVEVVGVTSIQGRISNLEAQSIDCQGNPEKEISLMPAFIKKYAMSWTVAISAEEVFNPDYAVTGIPHMVIIAPDGTVRFTGLHPATPLSEKSEKIDALLKEFTLKTPAKA